MSFVELCAGAGGMSAGFVAAGLRPLMLNDVDTDCVATLRANHEGVKVVQGDMATLDVAPYRDVDVLAGGVPCQSFSVAGKRRGADDDRGKLLFKFFEKVKEATPRVFVVENVKGLISMHGVLEEAMDVVTGDYAISQKVLNANDYSVPQKRERVFVVGVRNDIPRSFQFPTPRAYKPVLRDALLNCPISEGIEYCEKKKALFEKIPEGGCWVDLSEEEQREYMGASYYSGGGKRGILKRLHMDKPSLTLLTSPSQKQTERCHPLETRPLRLREYARIQTFPDSYHFVGSKHSVYKQIGNAVPVELAKVIGGEIVKIIQ